MSRALKTTILATLLLGSFNAAHALITISASYNAISDKTTVEASGSWDTWTKSSNNTVTNLAMSPTIFLALDGAYDRYSKNPKLSLVSGDALVTATGTSHTGDNWGFNTTDGIYAPVGYTALDNIVSTTTYNGDIFNIEGGSTLSGVYQGDGNTVNWSTVPEPATTGLLVGVAVACAVASRRPRRS
jgi:hypothetical protein